MNTIMQGFRISRGGLGQLASEERVKVLELGFWVQGFAVGEVLVVGFWADGLNPESQTR